MNITTVTEFPGGEQKIIDDLKGRGISVRVQKIDSKYSCSAQFNKGGRDHHQVPYADTAGEALRQISENLRVVWPDLFESDV